MKSKIYIVLIIGLTVCASIKSFSQANTSLSNLASPTAVNQDLLPNGNNILNLGSVSKSWKTLYIDNNIYLKDSLFLNAKGTQNTFVGQRAGYDISTGSNNAAYGFHALYNNTTGGYNSAFGSSALANNTASSNTAFGYRALYSNTTGASNTATGRYALYQNTTGNNNVAAGYQSLYSNTTGQYNIATGYSSLYANTTGNFNAATGFEALYNNTTGGSNVASGGKALYSNTTGYSNIALGIKALYSNSTGNQNIAIGDSALYNYNYNFNYPNIALGSKALYTTTTGADNVALGFQALYNNTTGGDNIALGHALYSNTTGYINTGIGYNALGYNTTGGDNVAAGNAALLDNKTGSYNTGAGIYTLSGNATGNFNSALGYHAGVNADGYSNATALGYDAMATASNEVMLGNTSVTAVEGYASYYNVSDARVKKNIKEDVPGLAFINALRPVTYNYDIHGINDKTGLSAMQNKIAMGDDNSSTAKASTADKAAAPGKPNEDAITTKEKKIYTGFVAQEVETAAKKLSYDFSGIHQPQNDKDLYALSYSDFVVPLVKGEQELSKMNDAKNASIDSLKSEIGNLKSEIEELKTMIANLPSVNNQQPIILSSASLAQNVPNPFANSTSISYVLPQQYSLAQIILTDKKGVTLKQISLNTKGRGSVSVDASTLSSGAYQYSLYINGRLIDTKQMVLAK